MIGIFVYVIILIAIVASLGFSVLQFNESAERSATTQRNASRMEAVVATLRGNSAPIVPGGVARLPAPIVAAPYDGAPVRSLLPTDIVGDDRTGWGARYGYCPLALPGGAVESGDPVDLHGGADYTILVASRAGRDFVVGTDGAPVVMSADGLVQPSNVMGFVVSPTPGNFDIPRCDEIVYRDGSYVIGRVVDEKVASPTIGGTVMPIVGDSSILSYVPAEFAPTIYVSEAGSGSGRSASDAMSLSAAVEWWQSNKPPALTIDLSPGAYDATDLDLDFESIRASDQLVIQGTGSADVTISGATVASFNQEIEIAGVTFTGNAALTANPGSRLLLSDVTTGVVTVNGGAVTAMSNSVLNGGSGRSAVEVLSGSVILTDAGQPLRLNATGAPAIVLRGGKLEVAADIQSNAPLLWSVNAGSLTIGRKPDGSAPQRDGTTLVSTISVTGPAASGNTASASCPAEQPYVVHASCTADRGALRSSYSSNVSTEGWACWWSNDDIASLGVIPTPTSARVDLTCSASPAQ